MISMAFRNYLALTIFIVLLMFGPIDNSWPVYLAIRIGYLILIPYLIWLLTGWTWNYWQPNKKIETTLQRVLSGVICIGLLILAGVESTSKTHIGNTKVIQTRDGWEAVGDDIVLPGPDWRSIFIMMLIAALVMWFGVLGKGKKTPE
jgi:hypothetical protein